MDIHKLIIPDGFMPIINFFGIKVPSYSFFVLMGFVVGAVIFKLAQKSCHFDSKGLERGFMYRYEGFSIAIAALIGSAIGSKLPIVLYYWRQIWASESPLIAMLSGRTVLGGMIGGLLAVIIFKRVFGIKSRFGNQLAPAVALGMAVGRLGCFFQGCCVGSETSLPWAVNFGDGIHRHPTQLYEIALHLLLFVVLWQHPLRKKEGGKLLTAYFGAYFVIRFFEEFIRDVHESLFGFSMYQWICLLGILFLSLKWQRQRLKQQNTKEPLSETTDGKIRDLS